MGDFDNSPRGFGLSAPVSLHGGDRTTVSGLSWDCRFDPRWSADESERRADVSCGGRSTSIGKTMKVDDGSEWPLSGGRITRCACCDVSWRRERHAQSSDRGRLRYIGSSMVLRYLPAPVSRPAESFLRRGLCVAKPRAQWPSPPAGPLPYRPLSK